MRLIDLKPEFANMSYEQQQDMIRAIREARSMPVGIARSARTGRSRKTNTTTKAVSNIFSGMTLEEKAALLKELEDENS